MTEKAERKYNRFIKAKLNFDSGYFDIQFGAVFLIFLTYYYLPTRYIFFIPLVWLVTFIIIHFLINFSIVKPRLAIFSAQYQPNEKFKNTWKTAVRLSIVILVLIFIFLWLPFLGLFFPSHFNFWAIMSHIDLRVSYLMAGIVILLSPFLMAYKFESPRLIFVYLINYLFLMSPLILPSELRPWSSLALGIVMLVSGLITLSRFTHKYPLPEKDTQPQSIEVEK